MLVVTFLTSFRPSRAEVGGYPVVQAAMLLYSHSTHTVPLPSRGAVKSKLESQSVNRGIQKDPVTHC
jgi:hypothetical protein